jgi:hypothetical protein
MNAPLRVSEAAPLGNVEDFLEVCDQQAWFYAEGWISLHTAVDNLQYLAERWGLVDELGQDAVQAIIAEPSAIVRSEAGDEPSEYRSAADIVRGWELADPRDCWKHTGETPPPEIVRNSDVSGKPANTRRPYSTPDSTISAFFFVARQDDADRLARWLADHSADKAELFKLWKAKRC